MNTYPAIGSKHGTVEVTSPAASKGGHAYWNTACIACGRAAAVRGTILRADTYVCRCQKPAKASAPEAASLNEMVRHLVNANAAISAKLDQVLATLAKAGQAPAPKPRFTVNSVGGGSLNLQARIDNFKKSVDTAEALAGAHIDKEEFLDRLRVEGEAIAQDPEPARREERSQRLKEIIALWP